jgi:hypothetical protein
MVRTFPMRAAAAVLHTVREVQEEPAGGGLLVMAEVLLERQALQILVAVEAAVATAGATAVLAS